MVIYLLVHFYFNTTTTELQQAEICFRLFTLFLDFIETSLKLTNYERHSDDDFRMSWVEQKFDLEKESNADIKMNT